MANFQVLLVLRLLVVVVVRAEGETDYRVVAEAVQVEET
jgi:hypothetical protein